jgi:hypothetical protein
MISESSKVDDPMRGDPRHSDNIRLQSGLIEPQS